MVISFILICLTVYRNPFECDLKDPGSCSVSLKINVDGIPIGKSTPKQFWSILFIVNETRHQIPFIVGVFCGDAKLGSVDDYISHFVRELLDMIRNGIKVGTIVFKIDVKKCIFVCDTLASGFLKCIKLQNARFACEKCTVDGDCRSRIVFYKSQCTF